MIALSLHPPFEKRGGALSQKQTFRASNFWIGIDQRSAQPPF